MLDWMQSIEDLSPAALTVRAQTIDPTDNGQLLWDTFFPRANVDSLSAKSVVVPNFRPAADRREFDGKGRLIPLKTPDLVNVEAIPIEGYAKYGEAEINALMTQFRGNQSIVRQTIAADIPDRVRELALADYRRLELDTFQTWTKGTLTVRNPQDSSKTYTASYNIASNRLTTAATAWNDVGVNAYDLFIAWLEEAISAVGGIQGVATRLAVVKAIQADAPTLTGGVKMTRVGLESRIQDDLGTPFRFYTIENTVDVFTDGGTATATTKVFPSKYMMAIPNGTRVGTAGFAPVYRADSLTPAIVEKAGIDTNGATVFYLPENGGRGVTLDCQLNAYPIPEENRVFGIDTGVQSSL